MSGKTFTRERCAVTGKWGYRKKAEAEAVREKMNGGRAERQDPINARGHGPRSPLHRLDVYRGECCGLWHIGNGRKGPWPVALSGRVGAGEASARADNGAGEALSAAAPAAPLPDEARP